jgi:hypothetical protein
MRVYAVRAVAFGILAIFNYNSYENVAVYYPGLMVLFLTPEFVVLTVYSLLFANWYVVLVLLLFFRPFIAAQYASVHVSDPCCL